MISYVTLPLIAQQLSEQLKDDDSTSALFARLMLSSYLIEHECDLALNTNISARHLAMTAVRTLNSSDTPLAYNTSVGYIDLAYHVRYYNQCWAVLDGYREQLEDRLEQHAYRLIMTLSEHTHVHNFDVITGTAALGRYFLDSKPKRAQVLQAILAQLVSLSAPREHTINGYYILPEHLGPFKSVETFPHGYLDLGMSHGIAGPMALLAIAYTRDSQLAPDMRTAIVSLLDIFKQYYDETTGRWPAYVVFKDGQLDCVHPHHVDSWCYGTPGIARAVYLAGRAIGDQEAVALSLRAMERIMERGIDSMGLECPTFCHGYAGAFRIFTLFARDTGLASFEAFQEELAEKLFTFGDRAHPYRFKKHQQGELSDSLNPLDGVASIFVIHAFNGIFMLD